MRTFQLMTLVGLLMLTGCDSPPKADAEPAQPRALIERPDADEYQQLSSSWGEAFISLHGALKQAPRSRQHLQRGSYAPLGYIMLARVPNPTPNDPVGLFPMYSGRATEYDDILMYRSYRDAKADLDRHGGRERMYPWGEPGHPFIVADDPIERWYVVWPYKSPNDRSGE